MQCLMSRLDGPHPGGYEHEGINAVNDSVRYRQLLPGVNWCSAGQFDCNRSRKQSAKKNLNNFIFTGQISNSTTSGLPHHPVLLCILFLFIQHLNL